MTTEFWVATLAIVALIYSEWGWGEEGVSVYHSERGRYSISLPSTWEKQELEMVQGVWGLFVLSPEEDGSDFFSENVNIIIAPADTTDLSEVNTRLIKTLKRHLTQFKLLDQAVGKIGQHLAAWIVHTFSYERNILKVIKYTITNGNEAYIITATALPETFERFRPIFDSIVVSIVFDEPAIPRVSPDIRDPSEENNLNVAVKLGAVIGAIVGFYSFFRALTKKK